MIEFLDNLVAFFNTHVSAQEWFIFGLICIGIELFIPVMIFLGVGIAAITTSALVYMWGIDVPTALLIFAISALIFSFIGSYFFKKQPTSTEIRTLNRRGDQLIGHKFYLTHALFHNKGRETIDGISWVIVGPDSPEGALMEVVRVEGNFVHVKAYEN